MWRCSAAWPPPLAGRVGVLRVLSLGARNKHCCRRQWPSRGLVFGMWCLPFCTHACLDASQTWQCMPDHQPSRTVAPATPAGVLMIGGFVGRGVEMRALQQAAKQLRLAVGFCEAIA